MNANFRQHQSLQSWMSLLILLLLLRNCQDGPAALRSGGAEPSAWEAGEAHRARARQRKPYLRGISGTSRRTERHVSLGVFLMQTLSSEFSLNCSPANTSWIVELDFSPSQHCQARCRATEAPAVWGAARIWCHRLVEGGRQGPLHQGETTCFCTGVSIWPRLDSGGQNKAEKNNNTGLINKHIVSIVLNVLIHNIFKKDYVLRQKTNHIFPDQQGDWNDGSVTHHEPVPVHPTVPRHLQPGSWGAVCRGCQQGAVRPAALHRLLPGQHVDGQVSIAEPTQLWHQDSLNWKRNSQNRGEIIVGSFRTRSLEFQDVHVNVYMHS